MKDYSGLKRKMPRWLKWSLFVLFIIIISCITFLSFFYQDIMENKTQGFMETKEKVLQTTDITNISTVSRFHGNKYYHIVNGLTDDHQEKFVFVPINDTSEQTNTKGSNEDYIVVDTEEIMAEEIIIERWEKDCANCLFINIVPALIDENPLWELTYRDDSDRYVIDYVSMYDGSQYEQLRLRKTFK